MLQAGHDWTHATITAILQLLYSYVFTFHQVQFNIYAIHSFGAVLFVEQFTLINKRFDQQIAKV